MHRTKNIVTLYLRVIWLLVILFFTTGFSAFSQKSDVDSIKIKKTAVVHSPRKATIYSAVLPGLGQIYNRKYWKLPLVYGGFVTLGYFINFNNELYVKYKQAYSDIIDTDPNTNSFKKLNVNPIFFEQDKISQLTERLRLAKDGSRRNRDLVVISTAVFYALNIIDASVDANFFNFDIGDDLTINWVPGPIICMDQKGIGLHCKITF
jgi:hypothetical protein